MFSKLDIFGSQIGLNFQKDNVYKTSFGGIMSMGFIAFVTVFFWGEITEFLNKDNVTFTSSKDYSIDPPTVALNTHQFMFAVKLDVPDFLTNPLFNITWERREYTTAANGTKIKTLYPMQFEVCRPDHWTGLPSYGLDWEQAFKDGGLQTFLCPRVEDVIRFGGSYNAYAFNFVKVQINECKNTTDRTRYWQPKCKSKAEVDAFFNKTQSVTIMFRMNNYVINPNDPKNPFKSFIEDSLFFPVQPGTAYQTADIYLTENKVKTDQSILPFQNIEQQDFMVYNGGNYRLQYVIGNTNKIVADFFLRKDPISYTHNRQFTKISQMASFIGGFCQTFILIAAIVVHQYNGYVCTIKIANKLYDFDLGDGDDDDFHQRLDARAISEQGNRKALDSSRPYGLSTYSNAVKFNTDSNNKSEVNGDQKQIQNELTQNRKQSSKKPSMITNRPKTREEGGLLPLEQIQRIVEGNRANLEQQNTQQSQNGQGSPQIQSFNITQKDMQQIPNLVCQDSIQNSPQGHVKSSSSQQFPSKFQKQLKKQYIDTKNDNEQISVIDQSILPDTPQADNVKEVKYFKSQPNTEQQVKTVSYSPDIDQVNFDFTSRRQISTVVQLESTKSNTALSLNKRDTLQSKNINSASNVYSQEKQKQNLLKSSTTFNPNKNKVKIIEQNVQPETLDEKQFLKKEFQYLSARDKSIKLSFKYVLYKLTCGRCFKTKEAVLLDKAQELMEQDMDIFMILNGIKEIQKFKDLFLTREQQILFNFFPKPIVSNEKEFELPSRVKLEEKKKEISQSMRIESKRETVQLQNHQKKLNLSFRVASLVQKATTKFKKPLFNKQFKYNSVDAYEKLYEAYKNISKDSTTEMNKKLIKQLGDEINKIFYISNQMEKNKERHIARSKNQSQSRKLNTIENQLTTTQPQVNDLITKNNQIVHSFDQLKQTNPNQTYNKNNNFPSNYQLDSHRPLTTNQINLETYDKIVITTPIQNKDEQNQQDNNLILFEEPSAEFQREDDNNSNSQEQD